MIKMRRKAVKPAEGIAMMTVGTVVEPVIATDTTATARTIEITAIETAAGETETGEMIEMATDTTERRGTLMTRGEMTATAVMTEDTAEAVTTIVGDATVMDIATAGTAYECILMMGISLILSLLIGRVWFKGSPETYQSQIRSQTRTIRKAMELPVHLNLL